MQNNFRIGCFFVLCTVLCACSTDSDHAGASALKESDAIVVKADTFLLSSSLSACGPIYASPDSFLLGECDTHFGTVKADILTQFACPLNFEYPYSDNAEVDSICLYLYYSSWYGDGLAPLGVTVYEMDGEVLDYNNPYPSDDIVERYCSMADSTHITPVSRLVFAAEWTDSVYSSSLSAYIPYTYVKLSDDFARKFFQIRDFSSQENFNELFKGLYITTDYGGSTILYVADISMAVYYHFTYPRADGQDTTVNDVKAFYANTEVRQINRYVYPDREEVMQELSQDPSVTYVVAPANIYTTLNLPMTNIYQRIMQRFGENTQDYRVYVNRANLTVDVVYDDEAVSSRARDNWDTPSPYMLLIRQENAEDFFLDHDLPSDTTSIIGSIASSTDSMDITTYSYTYDLSTMLTSQIRMFMDDTLHSKADDTLHLVLIPVNVETTTSSSTTSVTSVTQKQAVSATCLMSASNPLDPMNVEMVYSAFHKVKR